MTATVGIDPRIQARRTEVRRDAGLRRLRRLQAVGAVLVGLAVSFAITRSPALDVDRVSIDATGVDPAVVREVVASQQGRPMTEVDTQAIADALAALPSVESVEVRRSWPNRLAVEAVGSQPGVGVRAAGGGWLVVDRTGEIVAVTDEPPAGLLPLGGLEMDGRPGEALPAEIRPLAAVGAALPEALRLRAEQIDAGADGTVEVELSEGGRVIFASDGDHAAAAAAAAGVAATIPPGCVDRIDVLSPTAPVLRRADGC